MSTPAGSRPGWKTRQKIDRSDSDTRAVLVAGAKAAFVQHGYGRTTIADIAGEADVARATFYVYFASKAEVFEVVAREVCEQFVEAQELDGLDMDNVLAVARATNTASLDAYVDNLPFLRLLEHQAITDQRIADLRDELQHRPLRRTQRYIEKLKAAGLLDPAAAPEAIALASIGMSVAFAAVVADDPSRREASIDALTSMFLRLVGARVS